MANGMNDYKTRDRLVRNNLAVHKLLMEAHLAEGVDKAVASRLAFDELGKLSKAQKKALLVPKVLETVIVDGRAFKVGQQVSYKGYRQTIQSFEWYKDQWCANITPVDRRHGLPGLVSLYCL